MGLQRQLQLRRKQPELLRGIRRRHDRQRRRDLGDRRQAELRTRCGIPREQALFELRLLFRAPYGHPAEAKQHSVHHSHDASVPEYRRGEQPRIRGVPRLERQDEKRLRVFRDGKRFICPKQDYLHGRGGERIPLAEPDGRLGRTLYRAVQIRPPVSVQRLYRRSWRHVGPESGPSAADIDGISRRCHV